MISKTTPSQRVCETLVRLAKTTEELAFKEKGSFTVVLKKWHPVSAGVAAVTLHSCYGALLKHFLTCNTDITNEMLTVLQRADKLEKVLVNMVVEDSVECEDGGKTVVREMVPYDVDAIIYKFMRQSITGKLKRIKELVQRTKDTEVSKNISVSRFTCLDHMVLLTRCFYFIYERRHGIPSQKLNRMRNQQWNY